MERASTRLAPWRLVGRDCRSLACALSLSRTVGAVQLETFMHGIPNDRDFERFGVTAGSVRVLRFESDGVVFKLEQGVMAERMFVGFDYVVAGRVRVPCTFERLEAIVSECVKFKGMIEAARGGDVP